MFQSIRSKVSQTTNLLDLNHQLGRIKETVLSESSQYIENFSTDARKVSALVKSESGKINDQLFNGKLGMPYKMGSEDSNTKDNTATVTETLSGQVKDYSPISAFVDEGKLIEPEEDDFLEQNVFKYFEDDSDCEQIGLDDSLGNIVKKSKSVKLKKLQKKVKSALDNCKINAKVEADEYKMELLKTNPINDVRDVLEQYSLSDLKGLEKTLWSTIVDRNGQLLQLIDEKEGLELRNAEALADVKDLVSIMTEH